MMINKNTKVICQGFTGKQVVKSDLCTPWHAVLHLSSLFFLPRGHFIPNKLLPMAPTWLGVCLQVKEGPPT